MNGTEQKPTTSADKPEQDTAQSRVDDNPSKVPLALAAKLQRLSAQEKEAVAHVLTTVGEAGLNRIVQALAAKPKGRPRIARSDALLRQMAALLHANRHWKPHRAAVKVARSEIGKAETTRSNSAEASLVRRLTQAWLQHGPRLLQEVARQYHRPQVPVAPPIDVFRLRKDLQALNAIAPEFTSVQRLMDNPTGPFASYAIIRRLINDPTRPLGLSKSLLQMVSGHRGPLAHILAPPSRR